MVEVKQLQLKQLSEFQLRNEMSLFIGFSHSKCVFSLLCVLKKSTNKLYTEDVYSVTRPSVGSVQLKVKNLKLATRTNIKLQKKKQYK